MERTVKALDHVINYYMVSRELADVVQVGPHTSSIESLNMYIEVSSALHITHLNAYCDQIFFIYK